VKLFPTIEAALGGFEHAGGSQEIWRNQLRVCSSEMFDRYFQFGVPSNDLWESEFRGLSELVGDQDAFLARILRISERVVF
jgi:hypothetical protein